MDPPHGGQALERCPHRLARPRTCALRRRYGIDAQPGFDTFVFRQALTGPAASSAASALAPTPRTVVDPPRTECGRQGRAAPRVHATRPRCTSFGRCAFRLNRLGLRSTVRHGARGRHVAGMLQFEFRIETNNYVTRTSLCYAGSGTSVRAPRAPPRRADCPAALPGDRGVQPSTWRGTPSSFW